MENNYLYKIFYDESKNILLSKSLIDNMTEKSINLKNRNQRISIAKLNKIENNAILTIDDSLIDEFKNSLFNHIKNSKEKSIIRLTNEIESLNISDEVLDADKVF